MNIVIIYGTTEGQTRKISEFLKTECENAGHTVSIFDGTATPPAPQNFDAVIIGASVHAGKYQSSVVHYAKEHHQALNEMPSAFFSVSLTAAGDNAESWKELEAITNKFLKEADWKPAAVEQVAGALLYTEYDFFKRFIMRMISKKAGGGTDTKQDYEYTDWEKVRTFLRNFLATVPTDKTAPAAPHFS